MKKIFFALVAIFALAACVQEELPVVNGNNPVVGEGEVIVEGSILVPDVQDATRTFGSESINTLFVLVFDENGYLIQRKEAISADSFGVAPGRAYGFKVALGQSNYKRTIHLVAYNSDNVSFTYTPGEHMRRVVDDLYTDNNNEAFWSVVELPNGITSKMDDSGNTTSEPSVELQMALTKVPLVRNYAHITFTNEAETYLSKAQIMLCNIPNRGSVVARISDSNYAAFASRSGTTAENITNTALKYLEIFNNGEGYYGYEPDGMTLGNTEWGTSHYIYERRQRMGSGDPVDVPAFAIIRGTYNNETTYYKIDLCYTDEVTKKVVLYNLLRNMRYNITLKSVVGAGYKTLDEAIVGDVSNNLNFAVNTQNLNNISDGTKRLSVEYTQKVLTKGGDDYTYTLKYKYEPDIATGETRNGSVVFTGLEGNVIESYTYGTTDDSEGWRTFTFKAKAVGNTVTQDIVLTADNLQRQVRYILGNPYPMELQVGEKIEDKVGTKLPAKIILPEALPEGVFPLEIYVISANNSLTSSLPVITGLDATGAPATGGTYFGFIVTVEADDYYAYDDKGNKIEGQYNREVSVDLKTNMTGAAPADDSGSKGTLVTAYNPYFYPATDRFLLGTPYGLTLSVNNGYTDYSATTTFTIHSNSDKEPDIDPNDWSTDSSGNKYFDFDFTYTNDTVKLVDATFNGITVVQKDYVKVVDGNTLRIYKDNIYDANIRNFDLTFTSTSSMNGSTITVEHMAFGTASAMIPKRGLTMKFVSGDTSTNAVTSLSNGIQYYLLVELAEASTEPVTLNLIVSNINNTALKSGDDTVNAQTYTDTIAAGTTTYRVPLTATMGNTNNYSNASFTIKADAGSVYETATLNMTGGRAGSYGNRTYHYNVTVN